MTNNVKKYSKLSSKDWNITKSYLGKGCKDEHLYLDFCKRSQMFLLQSNASQESFMFTQISLYAQWLYRFQKLKHYFVCEEVYDFCCEAVKEVDSSYFGSLPFCGNIKQEGNEHVVKSFPVAFNESNGLPSGIVFNFPTSRKRHSLLITTTYNKSAMKDILYYAYNGAYTYYQRDNTKPMLPEHKDDPTFRFILGLSLYIDAFPECILPFVGGLKIGKNKQKPFFIDSNKTIKRESHGAISPHWRRGHFRHLISDKFKKSRGKTIYINGMMIKGKAYEVIEP